MGRPRKNPARTEAEIEALIAEEQAQLVLLQHDLREALIAGEDTRPYRAALAETEANITSLRATAKDARQAELLRRHAACAAEAAAIAAEAHTRHAALLTALQPLPFPNHPHGVH